MITPFPMRSKLADWGSCRTPAGTLLRVVLAVSAAAAVTARIAPAAAYEIIVTASGGGNYSGAMPMNGEFQQYDSQSGTPPGDVAHTVDALSVQRFGTLTLESAGSASADLRNGSVRASGLGNLNLISPRNAINGGGEGNARLLETLTFNIPGASPATATAIIFSAHVSGSFAGPYTPDVAGSHFYAVTLYDGTVSSLHGAGPPAVASFLHEAQFEQSQLPSYLRNEAIGGWDNGSVTNAGWDGADFTGSFTVYGAHPIISIKEELDASGYGTSSDFSGYLSLQVPDGVSFSSSSGVFLSEPVQSEVAEPASLALVLGGICLLRACGRRSRVAACSHAGPPSPRMGSGPPAHGRPNGSQMRMTVGVLLAVAAIGTGGVAEAAPDHLTLTNFVYAPQSLATADSPLLSRHRSYLTGEYDGYFSQGGEVAAFRAWPVSPFLDVQFGTAYAVQQPAGAFLLETLYGVEAARMISYHFAVHDVSTAPQASAFAEVVQELALEGLGIPTTVHDSDLATETLRSAWMDDARANGSGYSGSITEQIVYRTLLATDLVVEAETVSVPAAGLFDPIAALVRWLAKGAAQHGAIREAITLGQFSSRF